MGAEETDISELGREPTTELGQDDLRVLAGTRMKPPSVPSDAPTTERPVVPERPAPAAKPTRSRAPSDELRRAREWLDECQRELQTQPEKRRASRLHFEMARVCETSLKDPRRALEHYQSAVEHAPDYVPAIRAARRLLLGARMYPAALELFDAEARVTRQARHKAALYLLKGRLLEDVLGNREAAEEAYQTAKALDRTDATVLRATGQRAFANGTWQELDRNLAALANAASSDEAHRAALIIRRAQLLESRQQRPEQAAELYETALQLQPDSTIAVQSLKRLYYGQRRWRDLIRTLEIDARLSTDPATRAASLYRAARIQAERLGNRDEAVRMLEQARSQGPHDPLILGELARHYQSSRDFSALVETLEALVSTSDDPAEQLTLTQRIARLYEEELQDVDQAIAWHERALVIEPTSLPSIQALSLLYRIRGAWTKLIEMYLAEAKHTKDAQRRADAHARVAEIFENKLDAPNEAIEHYHRALVGDPDHAAAFKALTQLLSDTRRHKELIQLYENALDRANTVHAVSYLLKIAQVYEDVLAEHALAAQTYRRVLELDSGHLAAVHAWQRAASRAQRPRELLQALDYEIGLTVEREQLVNLLQRTGELLAEQLGDQDEAMLRYRRALEKDPRHVPSLSSLGRLYYAAGRWNDLLDVYAQELRLTSTKSGRVALLEKMAEISRDRLGSDEDAFGHYREAIKIDPTHATSLKELERQLRERGRWDELVDVLELQLRNSAKPRIRARAAFLLGQVYEDHLDDAMKATTAYETAVSADASYLPAVDALARVRARKEEWTRLLSDLEREIKLTADTRHLLGLHARKAQVLEQQDKPRQAIQAWEDVLALDPRHLGALLALEQLYRQVGAWEALAKVYATQTDVVDEPAGRIAVLYELARIQEHQGLGSYEDVVRSYRAIVATAPTELCALIELERLAAVHQDAALLREIDELAASSKQEPVVISAHRTRLAELAEETEVGRAIEEYRSAVHADPHNIGAARGLTRVAHETDDPAALIDALGREAETERDPKACAELYAQRAQVRLQRLRDHSGACGDFERALEHWPDCETAADGLLDVLSAEGRWSALADRLSQAASGARSVERAIALWLVVARIQSEELEQVSVGARTLQRVLKLDPLRVDALEQLALLHQANHAWYEAAESMEQLLAAEPQSERLRQVRLDLARLYHERLDAPEKALPHVNALLETQAKDPIALAELSIIHEKIGQLPEALQVARHLLAESESPYEKTQILLRLGHLEEAAGHREEAKTLIEQAVTLNGLSGDSSERFKTLCASKTDWRRYATALSRYKAGDEEEQIRIALEVAETLSEHCQDDAGAIEALRQAITHGRPNKDIERELAVRLRASGDEASAVAHLQSALVDAPADSGLWRELAVTYEAKAKRYESRVASVPIIVLGDDDDEDRRRCAAVASRPAHARPRSLRGGVLEQLGQQRDEDQAAGALLAALSPALAKLYPPELESYGLATRDRLPTEANHPLRDIANRLAATLDIRGFDLFLHRVRNRGVSLEFGVQPALLVPASMMERSRAEQTFMLARPLTQIARGYEAVEKLTPRELDVLLACAARTVNPRFGVGLTSEEFLNEQTRRLLRAIPRRDKKLVREAAIRYAEADRVKFARWVQAAQRTATRIALLLCDELSPLVNEVKSQLPPDGQPLEAHPVYLDALSFWGSAAAMHLREHMGMIPPSAE